MVAVESPQEILLDLGEPKEHTYVPQIPEVVPIWHRLLQPHVERHFLFKPFLAAVESPQDILLLSQHGRSDDRAPRHTFTRRILLCIDVAASPAMRTLGI